MKLGLFLCFVLFTLSVWADNKVVNVYAWGGELPKEIIHQFEKETGIQVNFSTYDSNETMYAKLKASRHSVYDVVLPSAYYVERMKKQGMLTPLQRSKLTNLKNLDPLFVHNDYDPEDHYSVPLVWGVTGIFYNNAWIKQPITSWNDLWNPKWRKKLLLIDDVREIFSMALMSLGFHPNDTNPTHIKLAYEKLVKLTPNIKLFAVDSIQAIIIDEDATVGSVWNGDAFKAYTENKAVRFVYPQEGFVIWVDCLAIPANPPHIEEAYLFVNFILRPDVAAQIATLEGHAITNTEGRKLLPTAISNNPMVYPSTDTLKRGYFQRDVDDNTITLFNEYWEELKLVF